MFNEFIRAALPWIFLGLFTAVSCSLMEKKEKKS